MCINQVFFLAILLDLVTEFITNAFGRLKQDFSYAALTSNFKLLILNVKNKSFKN